MMLLRTVHEALQVSTDSSSKMKVDIPSHVLG